MIQPVLPLQISRFVVKLSQVIVLGLFLLQSSAYAKLLITIENEDAAGEGFNDTSSVTPVGGNTGITLGQQRLIALEYAVDILANSLHSDQPITITANFNNLGGSAFSATLATAGPNSVHFDFDSAPRTQTYYVQALANKLEKTDLSESTDIGAIFNSDTDGSVVLGSDTWYYGLDASPPDGDIDFVSVALHELLHGFGFLTLANLTTGRGFNNRDDAYSINLQHVGASPEDFPSMSNAGRVAAAKATDLLVWNGSFGNQSVAGLSDGLTNNMAQLYAPNPVENGSSVSHFSDDLSPNELMEPNYSGARHSLGLAAAILADTGWGNLTDLRSAVSANPAVGTVGISSSFEIVSSNNGDDTAIATTVKIDLPSDATVTNMTTAQGTCAVAASSDTAPNITTIECDLGNMNSGQQVSTNLDISFGNGGSYAIKANTSANIVDSIHTNNSSTLNYDVLIGESNNVGPVANAGSDAGAAIGQITVLSGRASAGNSAPIKSYSWQQTSGATVALTDQSSADARFTVPNTSEALIFELTVVDENNMQAKDSITLTPSNPPIVNAGQDISLELNDNITLSTPSATDSDGSIMTVSWTQIAGDGSLLLSDSNVLNPTITAPANAQTFVLQLTVTDSSGLTATDTTTINVNQSVNEAASAGSGIASVAANTTASSGGGSLLYLALTALISIAALWRKLKRIKPQAI